MAKKPDLKELLKLVQAQAAGRDRMQSTAAAGATRAFEKLDRDDWHDPDKTRAAVKDALKVVQPAQRLAARNTAAFVARSATTMTGRTYRPAGAVDITRLRRVVPEDVKRALADGELTPAYIVLGDTEDGPGPDIDRDVELVVPDPNEDVVTRLRRRRAQQQQGEALDPGDPYGRAADSFRRDITDGKTEEQAHRRALLRIQTAAETDVTLAVRQQYLAGMVDIRDVRGYRRILHPELSKEGPCGLCVVAADRIYRVRELKALHARCRCETLPIIGELDPGFDLNAEDLEAIYRAAGGTGGDAVVLVDGKRKRVSVALKRLRVALAEHGELGPVLVDADQHYRDPAEVARTELRRSTAAA